jgi:putative nucleotidyltransferase with HDIG domain
MKRIISLIMQRFSFAFRNRGMRIFFIISFIIIVISTILLSLNMIGETYRYTVGDIAKESIRVPWEIVYPVELETAQEKRSAEESVLPVYEKDQYILIEKSRVVNMLFSNVETVIISFPGSTRDEQLKHLEEMLAGKLSFDRKVLNSIVGYPTIGELRRIILRIINDIYERGVIDDVVASDRQVEMGMVTIRTQTDERSYVEEKRNSDDLYTLSGIKSALNTICSKYTYELPKDQQAAVYTVVRSLIRSNVHYSAEETKRRMQDASSKVKPVMGLLKKGQVIVREGDSITIDAIKKINVINKFTRTVHLNYVIGIILIQFLFYLIFAFYISTYYHKIVPDAKAPYVIMILLLSLITLAYFIHQSMMSQDSPIIFTLLVPIPFVTMMVTILYNIPLAIISGAFATFFCFTINGGDYASLGIAISSSLLSIFGTRSLEKRTDFLRIGLIIGVVNAVTAAALGLMVEYNMAGIRLNMQVALIAGILNAVAVIGLFPVFEYVFGLTTIFKLYELSDLNAPIFKKMLIRAPGTYNHSIMVANLAEAACREIGADFLLARVGGYYHDIGKIDNAHIYIENKKNPNEPIDLPPQEYSRLIIGHVEKGVELARKHKLPQDVINFIREHHGDSMMTYFYHQALEKAQASGDLESVHRTHFQYPGPKPHSKESAIVMLADSIEAASRSVHEPSYVKLETLVKKIVYNRLNEGDLERSDLNMQELNDIQKAFLQVLNGIFHTRLEYPQNDEIKKLEEKVKGNGSY